MPEKIRRVIFTTEFMTPVSVSGPDPGVAPVHWRYDLNEETNPYFEERLGINAVMNSGAIELNGKYYLVVRVEGNDRKSFFAVAESDNGIDGFHFWDYPVVLPDTCPEETNVYDMRLTKHEDGWIYGVFCSESKDTTNPDLSAAVAQAGIVRTHDLKNWERLDNLKTLRSPQQRNVVLHPEFVDGKYAFYTRRWTVSSKPEAAEESVLASAMTSSMRLSTRRRSSAAEFIIR